MGLAPEAAPQLVSQEDRLLRVLQGGCSLWSAPGRDPEGSLGRDDFRSGESRMSEGHRGSVRRAVMSHTCRCPVSTATVITLPIPCLTDSLSTTARRVPGGFSEA